MFLETCNCFASLLCVGEMRYEFVKNYVYGFINILRLIVIYFYIFEKYYRFSSLLFYSFRCSKKFYYC